MSEMVESISDNLRIYELSNKTSCICTGHQIDQGQALYVEGYASSSTNGSDYIDWNASGLVDGSCGLVQANFTVRSVYTVIDLKAAPVTTIYSLASCIHISMRCGLWNKGHS